MKYTKMFKDGEMKTVEQGREARFEALGWTQQPASDNKPAKGTIKQASGTVKPNIVKDEEHDFLQQNQGFIDDNLNKENK